MSYPEEQKLVKIPDGVALSAEQGSRIESINRQYGQQVHQLRAEYSRLVTDEQRDKGRHAVRQAIISGQSDREQLRGVYQSAAGISPEQDQQMTDLKLQIAHLERQAHNEFYAVLSEQQMEQIRSASPNGKNGHATRVEPVAENHQAEQHQHEQSGPELAPPTKQLFLPPSTEAAATSAQPTDTVVATSVLPAPAKVQQNFNVMPTEILTGEDLVAAANTDETMWAATSAPIASLRGDSRFFELLARSQDDRIHASDLRRAVTWMSEVLCDLSGVGEQSHSVPLDAINTAVEEGRQLYETACRILQDSGADDATIVHLDHVRAAAAVANSLSPEENLEKLILFQAHLLRLANNFITFADTHNPSARPQFDLGALIIGGRRLPMAIKVQNQDTHLPTAQRSFLSLLYIEIEDPAAQGPSLFVLPIFENSAGNLYVGKTGLYESMDGSQYAARVVEVVDQPATLIGSFISPFKRWGRVIYKTVATVANPAALIGLVVGAGVAIAAIGSMMAFFTTLFANNLGLLATLVIGVFITISIVGALNAMRRIKDRNLGAVLEGTGWALNDPIRLSRELCDMMSRRADSTEHHVS